MVVAGSLGVHVHLFGAALCSVGHVLGVIHRMRDEQDNAVDELVSFPGQDTWFTQTRNQTKV